MDGGTIPLGYQPDGRTLKIVEEEAKTVRSLFDLYLQHGAIKAVKQHADRLGLRTKVRPKKPNKVGVGMNPQILDEHGCVPLVAQKEAETPDAERVRRIGGDAPFEPSHIHYILSNPVYAGRIRHRAQIHEGQHPAIVDPETWEMVQERLKDGAARKRGKPGNSSNSTLLASKMVDETGDRLTPSHANKKGRRYRYYVSNRLSSGTAKDKQGNPQKDGWRLPAKVLEQQMADVVLNHLRVRLQIDLLGAPSTETIAKIELTLDETGSQPEAHALREILSCIKCATIKPGQIDIELDRQSTADCLGIAAAELNLEALIFTTPFQLRKRGVESKLVIGAASLKAVDATLIRSIAKAHQ